MITVTERVEYDIGLVCDWCGEKHNLTTDASDWERKFDLDTPRHLPSGWVAVAPKNDPAFAACPYHAPDFNSLVVKLHFWQTKQRLESRDLRQQQDEHMTQWRADNPMPIPPKMQEKIDGR